MRNLYIFVGIVLGLDDSGKANKLGAAVTDEMVWFKR